MVHGTLQQPGTVGRRLQAFVGGRGRRLNYFLIRKHLGYDIEEWEALPWWKQIAYLEGMNSYFRVQGGKDLDGNDLQVDDDDDYYDYDEEAEGEGILGGDPNDLGTMGFKVVKGEG